MLWNKIKVLTFSKPLLSKLLFYLNNVLIVILLKKEIEIFFRKTIQNE